MLKTWYEKLPKFEPNEKTKLGETVVAEGVVEFERRRIKDEDQLFDFTDTVGVFTREHEATSYNVIDSTLRHLQGCRVIVKIELLAFPVKDDSIPLLKRISGRIDHDCEDPTYTEKTHKDGTRTLECDKCHKTAKRDKDGKWTPE